MGHIVPWQLCMVVYAFNDNKHSMREKFNHPSTQYSEMWYSKYILTTIVLFVQIVLKQV